MCLLCVFVGARAGGVCPVLRLELFDEGEVGSRGEGGSRQKIVGSISRSSMLPSPQTHCMRFCFHEDRSTSFSKARWASSCLSPPPRAALLVYLLLVLYFVSWRLFHVRCRFTYFGAVFSAVVPFPQSLPPFIAASANPCACTCTCCCCSARSRTLIW